MVFCAINARAWLAKIRTTRRQRRRTANGAPASEPAPAASPTESGASSPATDAKPVIVEADAHRTVAARTISPTEAGAVPGRPASSQSCGSGGVDEIPCDSGVLQALPKGHRFVSCVRHGFSAFSKTGKLTTLSPDGTTPATFFIKILKTAKHPIARALVEAEFASTARLHAVMPEFIPRPIAVGRYSSLDAHFFLTQFVDMDLLSRETATEPVKADLVRNLVTLHQRAKDPNAKFGKEGLSFNGAQPCETPFSDSWEECFSYLFKFKTELDVAANAPWAELDRATAGILTHVVPRLLSPSHLRTTGGGPIVPTYIHGDLYDNNIGVLRDRSSGASRTVMIDINGFYAHDEMELGGFVAAYADVARDLTDMYKKAAGGAVAAPQEEFEDRLRLYSLTQMLNYSAGHPGSTMRQSVYMTMLYLLERYSPGIEGVDKYDPARDYYVMGEVHTPHKETKGES